MISLCFNGNAQLALLSNCRTAIHLIHFGWWVHYTRRTPKKHRQSRKSNWLRLAFSFAIGCFNENNSSVVFLVGFSHKFVLLFVYRNAIDLPSSMPLEDFNVLEWMSRFLLENMESNSIESVPSAEAISMLCSCDAMWAFIADDGQWLRFSCPISDGFTFGFEFIFNFTDLNWIISEAV